jgi:homoserine dehydrogenase
MSSSLRSIKIGLIGLGTVGSGVLEIIKKLNSQYANQFGFEFDVVLSAARSEETINTFKSQGYLVTQDPLAVANHPEIEILVELAGGYDAPKIWLEAALNSGKHIVTANKALLAKYGTELFPLASKNKKAIRFEAAVGAGIPIIQSIQDSFVGNTITGLKCIINGTCNYILTRMENEGLDFDVVLADAQKLGYAEADPTFDIDGWDAGHKLSILASLASKSYVNFENIHISGIREIEGIDVKMASELGYRIKLLGQFNKTSTGTDSRVHACLLPQNHLLAQVNGVLNAAYIETDHFGPCLLSGAGAGKFPTASGVMADLVALARGIVGGFVDVPNMSWLSTDNQAQLVSISDLKSRYYLRLTTVDQPGVLAKVTGELSRLGLSVESLHQHSVVDPGKVTIVVIIHEAQESVVVAALESINAETFTVSPAKMIRFAV